MGPRIASAKVNIATNIQDLAEALISPLGIQVIKDPHNLSISEKVNGEIRQDSNMPDFIFNILQITAFCSQDTTFQAGSAILTGSPVGVGFSTKPPRYFVPGDMVEVTVGNVSTLVHGITIVFSVGSGSPFHTWLRRHWMDS